ncbi:helix-turn-helix domain-containing protein [Latilactobacillus sakei]|uniref:Mga helix-turn-helix domain protein n=1 Tax=Latilactobacillus sakei TaxID=1599 RepID=A0AAE8LWX3_LATSK|nr:helix-turn-helix domain-containing protein [Latilactobacillus sakei]SPE22951.1 Mga helix-turn-helix domain protein [Latilactobacillus sakei]
MKDFFLSSKAITLLQLFKYIEYADESPTLKEIMLQFSHSKITAIRYLKEIQQDLTELDPQLKLVTADNQYSVVYPVGCSFGATIFKLRYTYIVRTTKFQVMDALFKNNFSSIQALSEAVNLSPSTIQNIIKSLKRYFQHFHVSISFRGNQNIVGDPLHIRILTVYTYSAIYRGGLSPDFVTNRSKYTLTVKDHLSFSQRHQIETLKAVTYFDLIQKKNIVNLTPKLRQLLTAVNTVNPITIELPGFSEQTLQDESLLLGSLLRLLVANYDTSADKTVIAQTILALDTDFTNDIQLLLRDFFITFKLEQTETHFFESFYYLAIALIYLEFISVDVTDFLEFSISTSAFKEENINADPVFKSLQEFLNDEAKIYPKLLNSTMGTMLNSLFFFLLDYNVQIKPLKINVQYTKNFYAANMIIKSLQDVFGPAITFIDRIDQADFIVSDSYENSETLKGDFFLFNNIFNPHDWSTLLSTVLQQVYGKTFYKTLNHDCVSKYH